jgi:DNA-binding transcriptional ArsR family regulator
MNMLSSRQGDHVSDLFKILSDPFRVRLVLALSELEACVCHLERLLGKRQAYISQHLMSLREAGILVSRRDGKYIFYRLKDRRLLSLVRRAAEITGSRFDSIPAQMKVLSQCECPTCAPSDPIRL